MKRFFSVLLALALIVCSGGAAFAVTDGEDGVWRAERSGFALTIPAAYAEARGCLSFYDDGEGFSPGSGVTHAVVNYIAMPAGEYRELRARQREAFLAADFDALEALETQAGGRMLRLADLCSIDGGRGEAELRERLGGAALNACLIGEHDGRAYWLFLSDPDAFPAQAEEDYREEFRRLASEPALILDNIRLGGEAPDEAPDAVPTVDAPGAGVFFIVPESWSALAGTLTWTEGGPVDEADPGVVSLAAIYTAVTAEDRDAYDAFLAGSSDVTPKPGWGSGCESACVFEIFGIDGGRGPAELLRFLAAHNPRGDGLLTLRQLGRAGGTAFYFAQYAAIEDEADAYSEAMGELYGEFRSLCSGTEDVLRGLTLTQPQRESGGETA